MGQQRQQKQKKSTQNSSSTHLVLYHHFKLRNFFRGNSWISAIESRLGTESNAECELHRSQTAISGEWIADSSSNITTHTSRLVLCSLASRFSRHSRKKRREQKRASERGFSPSPANESTSPTLHGRTARSIFYSPFPSFRTEGSDLPLSLTI